MAHTLQDAEPELLHGGKKGVTGCILCPFQLFREVQLLSLIHTGWFNSQLLILGKSFNFFDFSSYSSIKQIVLF